MADHGVEIKKLFKEDKLVLGSTATFKKIKLGKISKVFVSKNCPEQVKKDLDYYANIGNIEIVNVAMTNEEIGVLCKKPFFISVIGVLN